MQQRWTVELSGGRKRNEPKNRRLGSTSIAELSQDMSELPCAALREGSMPHRKHALNQTVQRLRQPGDTGRARRGGVRQPNNPVVGSHVFEITRPKPSGSLAKLHKAHSSPRARLPTAKRAPGLRLRRGQQPKYGGLLCFELDLFSKP